MSETIRYFAYGSNMSEQDLKEYGVFLDFDTCKEAVLKGYKLDFNYFSQRRNAGAANIMLEPTSHVEGLLFQIDDEEHKKIRSKEGYPNFYDEIRVSVHCTGQKFDDVVTYKQNGLGWIS